MKNQIVSIAKAKNHWFELLNHVEQGKTYVITEGGKPVAQLAPLAEPAKRKSAYSSRPRIPLK